MSGRKQNFTASLADLVALALKSDRRRRYTQRLKILRQTDRAILTARTTAEIGETALACFQVLVPCKRASVALFDPNSKAATLIGVVSPDGSSLGIGSEISADIFGNIDHLRKARRSQCLHFSTFAEISTLLSGSPPPAVFRKRC